MKVKQWIKDYYGIIYKYKIITQRTNMARLVKIGTSYGVRIPKVFIEKANLKDAEINLKLCKNGLLLTPSKKYRTNWDTQSLRKKAKQDSDSVSLQKDFLYDDIKDWDW